MDLTCTPPSARVPAPPSRLFRALLGAAVGLLLACLLGALVGGRGELVG